ncbi:MAG: hypothetical protein M1840_008952 [Geoglossum simile]|nr:MAG: hypothetical protein M1840_008952 [Geoglossum simile]
MSLSERLHPLNMMRRSQQPAYSILPGDEDESQCVDIEKRSLGLCRDSGPGSPLNSSTSSSRSSSDSQLDTNTTRGPCRQRRRSNNPGLYKLPNTIVRYMCFAVILTIVVFIVSLVHMSWISSRAVELGNGSRPPAQWESFPLLERYRGGIRTLVTREENVPEYPKRDEQEDEVVASIDTPADKTQQNVELPPSEPFNPYPDYASKAYLSEYEDVRECFLDPDSTIRVPKVHVYKGVPSGMPDPIFGSYGLLGLRDDVCFERFGKLGPYGFGYSDNTGGTGTGINGEREGADSVWREGRQVDFRRVKWAEAQRRCAIANGHRFEVRKRIGGNAYPDTDAVDDKGLGDTITFGDEGGLPLAGRGDANQTQSNSSTTKGDGKKKLPRTAFIIRTWSGYQYRDDHILFLRSVISELSLLSGGEYTVHILVHVKDNDIPIWADEGLYEQTLRDSLPEEFWGLGTLWSERQMGLIYSGLHESYFHNLPVYGAYRGLFMAMQHFARKHLEYDYFWHWEMDIRYTGHFYHFLNRVSKWAKEQPRKGLWERNSRFYIPAVHGSWEDFKQMVRVQSEMDSENQDIWKSLADNDPRFPSNGIHSEAGRPIWGPLRPEDDEPLNPSSDPQPPVSCDKDKYQWGVGEEPDLITLNPLFDPDGTSWSLTDDITGYNTTRGFPPRRAAILTSTRLSRRLLLTMHNEMFRKRHSMATEMWPSSIALHHGLKAVFVPHPVYIDRRWPVSYLASVFDSRIGGTGGRRSVFGGMEHSFRGVSWYFNAEFAGRLWKRWVGASVDGVGGEDEEVNGEGRMCLRAMLLHPIKYKEGTDAVS